MLCSVRSVCPSDRHFEEGAGNRQVKLFISWSGERSRAVAVALRDWLPLILHYVQPWVSATDIDAGQRWATEVGQQLNDSSFGVLCLTRDNLQSPWILFEAGALAKSIATGAVVPYLLDLEFSDVTGPLAQFQAKKADRIPTFELITAINHRATGPVPMERVQELFGMAWPRLQQILSQVPPANISAQPTRSQREVLEELVQVIRAVEQRTRVLESISPPVGREDAQVNVETSGGWEKTAKRLLYENQLLGAIKTVRAGTGLGLKESKDLVDSWKADLASAQALKHSNRIAAIKLVREATDLGIKDARDLVDSW